MVAFAYCSDSSTWDLEHPTDYVRCCSSVVAQKPAVKDGEMAEHEHNTLNKSSSLYAMASAVPHGGGGFRAKYTLRTSSWQIDARLTREAVTQGSPR